MSIVTSQYVQATGRSPRLRRWYLAHEQAVLGTAMVVLFFVFWEGLSRGWWSELLAPLIGSSAEALKIPTLFISSPTRIALTAFEMTSSGEIFKHLWASGQAFALGGALSAVVGIPLGLIAGWYRRLNYAVDPFLSALNATPQVVFIPLIIIWVGTGLLSNTLIVFMVTVIPIAMSTLSGVRTIDARHLRVAKSFSSSETFLFTNVILPHSVPFVLTGLRLGVGRAMVGIVVGEIYGSAAGIGYMMNVAGMSFQTDRVFVGITVMAIVGLVLVGIIRLVEARVERWRPSLRTD